MLVYKNKFISFDQVEPMSRVESLQSPLTNIFSDQKAGASKEKTLNRWVTTLI